MRIFNPNWITSWLVLKSENFKAMNKYKKLTVLVDLPIGDHEQFTYLVSDVQNGMMLVLEQNRIKDISQYNEEKLTYWSTEFNKVLSRYNFDYKDIYFSNRYHPLKEHFQFFLKVGWIAKQTKAPFSTVRGFVCRNNNMDDQLIIEHITMGYIVGTSSIKLKP